MFLTFPGDADTAGPGTALREDVRGAFLTTEAEALSFPTYERAPKGQRTWASAEKGRPAQSYGPAGPTS